MLKVDRKNLSLTSIQSEKLAKAGYRECEDIRELIVKNPDAFFTELGEPFFVIGREVSPQKPLGDSIDILAVDKEGVVTVFELKRGKDKLQLLQAITYAAMISKWSAEQFFECRSVFSQKPLEQAKEEIENFLASSLASLNVNQRIVLIAEEYDPSVIVSAEWLSEKYSVEIECFRLALARDGGADFLSCAKVYPPAELMQFMNARGQIAEPAANWPDWETALSVIPSIVVRSFFESQIKAGQQNRLRYRQLIWRVRGVQRMYVSARDQNAYVWQHRRFKDDLEFWKSRLGSDAQVSPVEKGRSLRFYLTTEADFKAFVTAMNAHVTNAEFFDPVDDEGKPDIESN